MFAIFPFLFFLATRGPVATLTDRHQCGWKGDCLVGDGPGRVSPKVQL